VKLGQYHIVFLCFLVLGVLLTLVGISIQSDLLVGAGIGAVNGIIGAGLVRALLRQD
jgi:hypothetical protein